MNPLSIKRQKELQDFCLPLNLHFKSLELLELAFRHSSYPNEARDKIYLSNERLEFLGDSVLGLAAADFLYRDMADNSEGDLAKIKSVVVSEKVLASLGLRFGIDRMLRMGRGEEISGGRRKPAIIADCMEAVIGAYYLDAGFEAAKEYVISFLLPEIRIVQKSGGKDYKSLLQEFYQQKYKCCPVYTTVSVTGPDHALTFTVIVQLGDVVFGPATGTSRKAAEQNAARIAYEYIKQQAETE